MRPPSVPLYSYIVNSTLFQFTSTTLYVDPKYECLLEATFQGTKLYSQTVTFTNAYTPIVTRVVQFGNDVLNKVSPDIISYTLFFTLYSAGEWKYQAQFETQVPQSQLTQAVGTFYVDIGGAFINKDKIEISLEFLPVYIPPPSPIVVRNGFIVQAHGKIYSRVGFRHGL